LYELLSNVSETFGIKSDWELASQFYSLSVTNKTTQMGCDYVHTDEKEPKALHILCFYNYP
ncbi:hypothetical protein PHET_10127, partial [Paragonimus heterotremus]